MPSYTPTTTLSPTAVNQDSGKLDEMIGIVQGMLQQRQQSRESAFRGEQMQRTKQSWLEEDQNRDLMSRQDQNFRSLATNRNFNTGQVNQMLLANEINPNQANALIPLAIDYVSPEQRAASLASALEAGQVNSLEALYTLASESGVEENTARWLWNEYQQAARATAGAGGAGGSGTGRAANGDTTTNVEAKMARLNALYTEAGMRLPSLPALQANAEHFDEALTVINNAQTALNSAKLKVGGVLQTRGRIYTGTNTASFREIPGYAGYVVRVDSDGDIKVERNGRRITINTDPKAIELANMLSGATASDLIALARARTAYREALRSERDRLNRLQGGTNLLDEERQ